MQMNVLRLPAGNVSRFHISSSWHRTAVACPISPVSDMETQRLRLLYCSAAMRSRQSATAFHGQVTDKEIGRYALVLWRSVSRPDFR